MYLPVHQNETECPADIPRINKHFGSVSSDAFGGQWLNYDRSHNRPLVGNEDQLLESSRKLYGWVAVSWTLRAAIYVPLSSLSIRHRCRPVIDKHITKHQHNKPGGGDGAYNRENSKTVGCGLEGVIIG